MKTSTFHTRWYIAILVLFFCLLVTFPVEAGTLNGTVKGRNGQLKRYVRVEIGGPETKIIFTNEHGRFSIQLSGGKYIVKIVERNSSMEFNINVPQGSKSKEVPFNLKW